MARVARSRFTNSLRAILTAVVGGLLAGCQTLNTPLNTYADLGLAPVGTEVAEATEETFVGLAFSGGGTRAAAFAHGLLLELNETRLPGESGRPVLSAVRFVSGVSGGSVTAAYYGMKGVAGLSDFRERFLVQDAESYMRKSVANPFNLMRAFSGGVNDRSGFARWLDRNLFDGQTFASFRRDPKLTVWINASDVFNQTPFIFDRETFRALCSDLDNLPIAEAVAASAAVPVIFAPVVLEAYGPKCNFTPPAWMTTAAFNPEATASLRAYAKALATYRDPAKMRYVKLLDGGITDNFGVTGLAIARAASQTEHGPLSAREAVKLKRLLFIVANAGRQLQGEWANQVAGPGGFSLVMALADTATASATRQGYDAFRLSVSRWHEDLIKFRCSLSNAQVRELRGTTAGWDCKDVKLFVGEIRFDQLDPVTQEKLNGVPTRLRLAADQVDLTIAAARTALRSSPEFNGFLRSLAGFDGDGDAMAAIPEGADFLAPDVE